MNKITYIITALLLTTSCVKQGEKEVSSSGYGAIELLAAVDYTVEELTRSLVELPQESLPTVDDFSVTIKGENIDNATGDTVRFDKTYDNIDAYNSEIPSLIEGEYIVAVSAGDSVSEGADSFYFKGESSATVEPLTTTEVSVTAEFHKSAIKVTTTDWFDKYYPTAYFEVTTSAGNSFNFSSTDSTKMIYVATGTTLTLSGSAIKSNGFNVDFPEQEIGSTTAKTLSNITIDASDVGGVEVTVTFSNSVYDFSPYIIETNPDLNNS
ncbi:MAG: DUF4493 domain-containing protein [Rikenellaceae bacterium]